jgi:hypothetical protein
MTHITIGGNERPRTKLAGWFWRLCEVYKAELLRHATSERLRAIPSTTDHGLGRWRRAPFALPSGVCQLADGSSARARYS